MASFWFWFFLAVGSAIAGIVLTIIVYGVFTLFHDMYIKRGMPKDKVGITLWAKENKERLAFNYNNDNELNKIKEDQHELRRRQKFREFEKLRRIDLNTGTVSQTPADGNTTLERTEQLPRRELLSDGNDGIIRRTEQLNQRTEQPLERAKPKIRLDD